MAIAIVGDWIWDGSALQAEADDLGRLIPRLAQRDGTGGGQQHRKRDDDVLDLHG
jgi:hypothetical protein